MNVERSAVGTKKSRQPKRQKSIELVQSRQSLTTVRQEVLSSTYSQVNQVSLSIDDLLGFASQKKQCEILVRIRKCEILVGHPSEETGITSS